MTKYIDADALKEELQQKVFDNYTDEFWGTMQVIDEMPAADVESVEHGEWWNEYDDYSVAKCSNCGATFETLDDSEHYSRETLWELFKRDYSHCPNCGALMVENETDKYREMYAIPNSEPPAYTPEEKSKIKEWCEEAGIDPNMIRGMKEPPKMDGGNE